MTILLLGRSDKEVSMPANSQKNVAGRTRRYCTISIAAVLYIALGVYLYEPYFKYFSPQRCLVVAGSICGALGCFVLSRRWISAFGALLFAGAIYGFSPFALGFAAYHPSAVLPLAILPWLFWPAAFWSVKKNKTFLTAVISAALSLLPFVIIPLFFWLCAQPPLGPLFPLPLHIKLHFADVLGLIAPQATKPHEFAFGFYHVPLIVGLMGLFMYLTVHRIKVMILIAAGLVLAFAGPVLQTPPIVWALVPMLSFSVLIGLGTQGLALAGPADRKWILFCLAAAAALAILTILAAVKLPDAFGISAKMYGLACVLTGSIFFIAKAGCRWRLLRWVLLCAGLGIDILLGARFIVDKIF
ncbi:MAG: hypothetical protein DRP65_11005 [Planctomycetota bacterium]|nr:MAG: hypothetical protein DRP65_11005 [Planctomycetota bacterium]